MYYVYLIISKKKNKKATYVGYTNNLKKRISMHNSNRGAKRTRGRIWKMAFKKKFRNKSTAMSYEYFLKKNIKMRKSIKDKYEI